MAVSVTRHGGMVSGSGWDLVRTDDCGGRLLMCLYALTDASNGHGSGFVRFDVPMGALG